MPTRRPIYYLVLKDYMTTGEVKHHAGDVVSLSPTAVSTIKLIDDGYITLYDGPAPHVTHPPNPIRL